MGAIVGLLLGLAIIVVVWFTAEYTTEGSTMRKFFESKPKSTPVEPIVYNMGLTCVSCKHSVGSHSKNYCGMAFGVPGLICGCEMGRDEAAKQAYLYGKDALRDASKALNKAAADLERYVEINRGLREQIALLQAENAELKRTQYPQDKVV